MEQQVGTDTAGAVWVLEVREPDGSTRHVDVTGDLEVGRDCSGVLLDDPLVSRRHLRVEPATDGVLVTDLQSANGTTVDGTRLEAPSVVAPGRIVRLGDTELHIHRVTPAAGPVDGPGRSAATPPPVPTTGVDAPAALTGVGAPSPATDDGQAWHEVDARSALVRYRPGRAGEELAREVARAARRARGRLERLAPPGWRPIIHLVDPFPDPEDPARTVASGTLVDTAARTLWVVVTPEAPPEPLERPLALLLTAELPAGEDLALLLEGYGLHLADAADPDDQLRAMPLPSLAEATGELRSAMALSFVRSLLEGQGEDAVVELLTASGAGRVDETARRLFSRSLIDLEGAWHRSLQQPEPDVGTGEFVRLAVTYLKPHKRKQAEVFAYMLLGLGFTMVFPFVTQRLFDQAIPSGEFGQVLTLLLFLGAALAISLVSGLRRAYLSASISSAIVRDVRQQMFDHLQRLSTGWYHRYQQGDVISRMFSDVGIMERGLSMVLRDGIFQLLSLVVATVILLTLDPLLGAIVVIGAPLVALVYRGMSAGARERSVAVQERQSSLLSVASENYSAEPVVKLFSLEDREQGRFRRAADRLFRAELRMNLFGGLFGLSVNTIVAVLRLLVLGIGAWMILDGRMTLGTLVAFLGIMGEVISPVTALTGIGQQMQSSTGALIRINEVLETEPAITDPPDAVELPPLTHAIELRDVVFGYRPSERVIDGVDVTITAGSRVAFVGPSGSGKSTVLALLMRLYEPEEGVILHDGIDRRTGSLASLRDQLGVVFQDNFLFDTSVRENIAMGAPGATDEQVEAAARAAEIHDTIMRLPHGYDTPVGERGTNLSGGQRQRVAIARALIRDPRILLLDEATSALDPRTERQVVTTLNEVGKGRTTIAITHRLTSVVDYDRIVVLVAGRVAEQGTHEELLATRGVYARMWAEQTGEAIPLAPGIDLPAALGRIVLFQDLSTAAREEVGEHLRAAELTPGQLVPEGGGRVAIVARGRARVLVPSLGGRLTGETELGPGDAFGVTALLGEDRGTTLQAIEPTTLLVLDDEQLRGLAARYPEVAARLTGGEPQADGPRGRRLERATFIGHLGEDGAGTAPRPPAPPPLPPLAVAAGDVTAVGTREEPR
jgi:ATP-binding cassette subfamily B protein